MVNRLSEIIKLKDNTTIKYSDLSGLKSSSNLKYLRINDATFENVRLLDLYIDNSKELEYLDLSGSVGIILNTAFPDITGIYPHCPVPMEWRYLTKLKTIALRDCGLTPTKIDNLIIGLSQVVAKGLGSAVTGNKLYIDGTNGAPTSLSSTQLAYLEGEGWEIIHSQSAATPLPVFGQNVFTAAVSFSETFDNGIGETVIVTLNGLVMGGNYNIVLNTVLDPGIEVSANVTDDDELTVTVLNGTTDDDVTIPTLNFNIYKI
jgi:hypothetical protein